MPYDWRMNPYKCIVCETRVQDCRCCDTGAPTLPFVVVIDGCGTFAGRYEFDALRYRSPTALPTGVSYPATDPCGVFWGTLSAGDGCSAGGTAWSGSLGLLSWCDGTDAAIPWHVEIYCYSNDSSAWVSQGEATVTSYECRCDGPRFAFTLPTIDCCCDATLIVTDCCPDGIPDVLAIEFFNSSDPTTIIGSGTISYAAGEWTGVVNFCGENATVVMTCEYDGFDYYWNLYTSNGFNVRHSGRVCDPLEIVFQTIFSSGPCLGEQIGANVT